MLSFKQFIIEANLSGGKNAEYHVQKYIEPYIGKKGTHSLSSDIGGIKANSPVTIHSHHVDSKGKRFALVSGMGSEDKVAVPFSKIKKPIIKNPLSKEDRHQANIRSQIDELKNKNGTSSIPILIGDKLHHVSSVENIKGTPKADFSFNDTEGNPVHYVSHKDGKTAKDFQQLGGVSHAKIKNHPAVSSFVSKLKERFSGGVPKGAGTAGSSVLNQDSPENRKLIHHSVFGHEHGSSEYGPNNVHSLIQGNMTLHEINHPVHGKVYKLKSDGHMIHNENSSEQKMPFETKIMAMHRGDRNDQGLNNTRIMILPHNSRKVTHNIE